MGSPTPESEPPAQAVFIHSPQLEKYMHAQASLACEAPLTGAQPTLAGRAVDATIEKVKANVFGFHGL